MKDMGIQAWLRLIAGIAVMLSVALGHLVSPYFYLFTVFVGLNLFQSAFTRWCPMWTVLRKMGVAE
jgi:E3 ubiquitin-protein ligase DOA10